MDERGLKYTSCPVIDLTAFYCSTCYNYRLSSCPHQDLLLNKEICHKVMKCKLLDAIERLGYFMISLPSTMDDFSLSPLSILYKAREVHHNVRDVCHEFFRQPLDHKMQAVSIDRARRGFSPISTENFASLVGDGTKPNDTVEKFRIGPIILDQQYNVMSCDEEEKNEGMSCEEEERNEGIRNRINQNQPYYDAKPARIHFFPNDWQHVSQSFREISHDYYETMYQLGMIILTVIESCCNLQLGSLTEAFEQEKHTSILCYNYYPPIPLHGNRDRVIERIAEHTDVSTFTIVTDLDRDALEENDVSLEIFNAIDQRWEPVEYSRGMYLINIGDCLSERSQSRLTSALHRVVMRPNNENNKDMTLSKERFSCAFFFAPNYDAKMTWYQLDIGDCHQSTTSEGGQVVDYDTWRKQRVKRAMNMLKKGQLPSDSSKQQQGKHSIKKAQKKEKQAKSMKSMQELQVIESVEDDTHS